VELVVVRRVPDTSGNVHVLAPVRSSDVIVPVKGLATPVDCGRIAILSELVVEEAKTAEPVVPKVVVSLVAAPVFKLIPPVPEVMVAEVAPVALPRVIVLAAASVPKFNAPVPVCKVTDELSVVPIMEGPPGALPPINHEAFTPVDKAIVPDASGRIHVLAAVKSAVVIVPVFEAATAVDCGRIDIRSEPAVEEAKTAEPVVPNVVVVLVAGAVFKIIPPVPALMVVEVAPVVFPIVTSPVEVPVFIFVAKLEPLFKLTVPPVEVKPA